MSVPGNLFVTESAIGLREDISELIHNISPTETPFLSAIGTTDAIQQYHQWQLDDLRAPQSNAKVEGIDATLEDMGETTLVGNYEQISDKTFGVSGTYEVAGKYGRDSQLAYLAAKAARELKTDVDLGMTGLNVGAGNGAGATARTSASIETWLTSNTSFGAGGSNATLTAGSPGTRGDGTIRAFTQALLDGVLAAGWENGAKPTLLLMGATQKGVFGGFDGVGNTAGEVTRSDRAGRTVYAAADFYWSHLLGRLTVVPTRHIRKTLGTAGTEGSVAGEDRAVFAVDPEYAKTAYLRPWQQYDLAKTGDSIRRQMLVEWTLEMCTEKAHCGVFDVGTP